MSKGKSKAKAKQSEADWPQCQLMLQIEPGPGARERLVAALGSAKAVAVLIRPKAGDQLGAGEVKPLVDVAQKNGAAVLLYEDVDLAKTLRADGVHIPASLEAAEHVTTVRAVLGPDANVGVEAGGSRHLAMAAGEAGADYVAFGAGDGSVEARKARDDLVQWWAEIFEVPCVALDLETADEAEVADQHGADFASLALSASAATAEISALVADAGLRLAPSGDDGE